jgi:DNA-binding LytR/AlgR family response regulator
MIKCISIDDEPFALNQISGYIRNTPFLELMGQFNCAIKAIEFLEKTTVDLMFVDIGLPDISGIDFVKTLKNPPRTVFITAHCEYALDGFLLNAIDYLLKPISYVDFLRSANRANDFFKMVSLHEKCHGTEEKKEFLFVKSEYRIIKVKLEDIIYVRGMREYTQIFMLNNEPITPLLSLHILEEQLPQWRFMRVHRSFIINLGKIKTVDHNKIILDGNFTIPLSERYRKAFYNYIDSSSLD